MPRANSAPIELNIVQANRFWSNVTGVSEPDGCWLWSGRVDGFGYGHFKNQKRSLKAHRVAWTLKRGPIAIGVTLDHLCRTPRCVNPAHLEAVTNKENIRRGNSPTAANGRKTHCSNGHELTPDNTYRYSFGGGDHRFCKTCSKLRMRERRRR